MRREEREPSRPGLVGDKPQSGESGSMTSPLRLVFFFGVNLVCSALESAALPNSLRCALISSSSFASSSRKPRVFFARARNLFFEPGVYECA